MPKGRTQKTMELIQKANEILQAENPMTLRQLFYRLVSDMAIKNSQPDYKNLSRILTKARELIEVDSELMVDRSKPEIIPDVWEDPSAYLKSVARSYRRDYWTTQSFYTELWLEKDSLTGCVEDTVSELGITLRAHRGYGSTTKKMEIADLFDSIDKPIIIFYLGDFDPSGMDIERDLLAKIKRYMATDRMITVERLAILQEDIALFNLPPLRAKEKDSRSKSFKAKYGSADVVECDALPPVELRQRVKDAVSNLIDWQKWNINMNVERAEFESIKNFAENFKSR